MISRGKIPESCNMKLNKKYLKYKSEKSNNSKLKKFEIRILKKIDKS